MLKNQLEMLIPDLHDPEPESISHGVLLLTGNNRELLDVESPNDDFIWSGIEAELKPKKTFQLFSWKAAALILMALMSGFVLNSVLNRTPQVVQISLADISPQYAAQEQFYQASIKEKWAQIEQDDFKRNDFAEIFNEIDHLEQIKAESLKDLAELGGNPRLVKTLFEYYEIKIRLLEIMLEEIDKNKNDEIKTQNHEKYY